VNFIVTNDVTAPVALALIEILTADNESLLRLDGDCLESMTQLGESIGKEDQPP
jgi:hypothetical protein